MQEKRASRTLQRLVLAAEELVEWDDTLQGNGLLY